MRLGFPIALTAILFLTSCGPDSEPEKSAGPGSAVVSINAFGERPEAGQWTRSALAALDAHGAPLVEMVPADIDAYCPTYAEADETERKAFWVKFLSALAKHESTWRPDVSGGGGAWHGLLQIAPATARGYGCVAQNAGDLKDGSLNLSCAIRIMATTVPRDGVISAGMQGVAADWGPFHVASKRADIQTATRQSPVCRG